MKERREIMATDIFDNIYDAERSLEAYHDHVKRSGQIVFKFGIDLMDRAIEGVSPGEVMTLVARSGVWKTTFLQMILQWYLEKSDLLAVFFSIEMPVANIVNRYRKATSEMFGDVDKTYRKKFKNLIIMDKKVSPREISEAIPQIESRYSRKVGLIGIDYLGLMAGKGNGEYEKVPHLARDIKLLAKILNLPIILVAQCSRKAGDGTTELSLDMIRDSGAIEESADFVLGLWKQEVKALAIEGRDSPEYEIVCKLLKNRKGPSGGAFVLEIDAPNFRIKRDATVWTRPKRAYGAI